MNSPKSFLILWHATEKWDWIENHEGGPHDYAWGHELYGKSSYSFIPCEKPPEAFLETPEDTLLNKIFKEAPKSFPWNPKHPHGTCAKCGEEMAHNVPRMGAAGGFVHENTRQLDCAQPVQPVQSLRHD